MERKLSKLPSLVHVLIIRSKGDVERLVTLARKAVDNRVDNSKDTVE
jgi:hypothetical protein